MSVRRSFLFSVCVTTAVLLAGAASVAHARADKPTIKAARETLLRGDVPGAISLYAAFVKAAGQPDSELFAEQAYALALGGFHDLALANLDRARLANPDYLPTYYFAARVLELTGQMEAQVAELWPKPLQKETPGWIKYDALKMAEAHGRKVVPAPAGNMQEEFTRANRMLSQQYFFQAAWVLRGIVAQGPDHPAPYMGYAIALEKIGAPESAIRVLKKALQIAENQKSGQETRGSLRARIKEMEERVATESPEDRKDAKGLGLVRASQGRNLLFFVGGQLGGAGDASNQGLTMRLAKQAPGRIELGVDLGLRNTSLSSPGATTGTSDTAGFLGLSARRVSGSLLSGAGFRWSKGPGFVPVFTFGIVPQFSNGAGRFEFIMDLEYKIGDDPAEPGEKKFFADTTFTTGITMFFGKR